MRAVTMSLLAVWSATLFWLPTTLVQLLHPAPLGLYVGTLLGPFFLVASRWTTSAWRQRGATLWALGGVYALGPWFMSLTLTLDGGGFAALPWLDALKVLLIASVFPPLTLELAVGDGTALGLLLATLLLPVLAWAESRRRPAEAKAR